MKHQFEPAAPALKLGDLDPAAGVEITLSCCGVRLVTDKDGLFNLDDHVCANPGASDIYLDFRSAATP